MSSEGERGWWYRQALASTRIEGHVPTPEFLADCAAYVAGEISNEDARARSLARALQEQAQQAAPPATNRPPYSGCAPLMLVVPSGISPRSEPQTEKSDIEGWSK